MQLGLVEQPTPYRAGRWFKPSQRLHFMKDTGKEIDKNCFLATDCGNSFDRQCCCSYCCIYIFRSSIKHSEAQVICRAILRMAMRIYRSHWSSLFSYFAYAYDVFGHPHLRQVNFIRETKLGYIYFMVDVKYFSYFSLF